MDISSDFSPSISIYCYVREFRMPSLSNGWGVIIIIVGIITDRLPPLRLLPRLSLLLLLFSLQSVCVCVCVIQFNDVPPSFMMPSVYISVAG